MTDKPNKNISRNSTKADDPSVQAATYVNFERIKKEMLASSKMRIVGSSERAQTDAKKQMAKIVSINSTPRQMGRSNSNKETKHRNVLQTIPDSN